MDSEITLLLNELNAGNRAAFSQVFALVYDELRRLAAQYMRRERQDHTLQTTALVNEAYLRLVSREGGAWKTRLHFFAVAATVMRHILVDHARTRNSARRGGGAAHLSLQDVAVLAPDRADEILAVDRALDALATIDARQAQIVELRYFGGLTLEETAQYVGVSPDTISRDWNLARAFLYRQVAGSRE